MDTSINFFSTIASEVITIIASSLDAVSLVHFCQCSRALKDFYNVTNDQWRVFYANQWCVGAGVLQVFKDLDWASKFIKRYHNEKQFINRLKETDTLLPSLSLITEATTYEEKIGLLLTSKDPTELVAVLTTTGDSSTEDFVKCPLSFNVVASSWTKVLQHISLDDSQTKSFAHFFCTIALDLLVTLQSEDFSYLSVLSAAIDLKQNPILITAASNYFWQFMENLLEPQKFPLIVHHLNLLPRLTSLFEYSNNDLSCETVVKIKEILDRDDQLKQGVLCRPTFAKRLLELMAVIRSNRTEYNGTFVGNFCCMIQYTAGVDPLFSVANGIFDLALEILRTETSSTDVLLVLAALKVLLATTQNDELRLRMAQDKELIDMLLQHLHSQPLNQALIKYSPLNLVLSIFAALKHNIVETNCLDEILPYLEKAPSAYVIHNVAYCLQHCFEDNPDAAWARYYPAIEQYLPLLSESENFPHAIHLWSEFYHLDLPIPANITARVVECCIAHGNVQDDQWFSIIDVMETLIVAQPAMFKDLDISQVYETVVTEILNPQYAARIGVITKSQIMDICILFLCAASQLAHLAQSIVSNEKLLSKLYSLANGRDRAAMKLMCHLALVKGWDNSKALAILAAYASLHPDDCDLQAYLPVAWGPECPLEVSQFTSWLFAILASSIGDLIMLKANDPVALEWLMNHTDPIISRNMEVYQKKLKLAQQVYDI